MEFDYSEQLNKKIRISEKNKSTWVEVESISHLVCEGYLTTIHLTTNESITCSMLLKQFQEILDVYGFLRANRNTLVNGKHIDCIIFKKGKRSIFINNIEVKVSRRKAFLFKR